MNIEKILEIIIENTCEIIPELEGHNFVGTDSLKDLGANSMDRADIIMMTMDALSQRFPLIQLAEAKNISELAKIFLGKCEG